MKIGFFCINGLESFVAPISQKLKDHPRYDVTENWITDLKDIEQRIAACDIVWFEWANEIAEIATYQLAQLLQQKIVILRLHSYEALAQKHHNINWDVVNTVIFVGRHVQRYCHLDHPHQCVIPNGIPVDQIKFRQHHHGEDIAFVGGLSHKKGIMLLAHAFSALPGNFKLHIAGEWQDDRERIYFAHITKMLGVAGRINYVGRLPQKDLFEWLGSKDYILCTSPWESHNLSICEAMAAGLKPLIHNFWGVETIYPGEYVWTDFHNLTWMVHPDSHFDSFAYRKYIKKHYDFEDKIRRITDLIAYLQSFGNPAAASAPQEATS